MREGRKASRASAGHGYMENTPGALRGGDRLGHGAFLRRIPCEGANAILCSGGLGPKAFRPDRQPALIAPEQGDRGPVPKQVLGAG